MLNKLISNIILYVIRIMKKSEAERLVRGYFRVIEEGLLEEAIFEQRPEGGEGVSRVEISGRPYPGRGNSKRKGPEAGTCLNKEPRVVEMGDEDSEPAKVPPKCLAF